jgi:hypothetical protein
VQRIGAPDPQQLEAAQRCTAVGRERAFRLASCREAFLHCSLEASVIIMPQLASK